MKSQFIILHDSDSRYGNVLVLNDWHKKRGFKFIHPGSGVEINVGYHYCILNGSLWSSSEYSREFDGALQPCRPEGVEGAHCLANGRNRDSLGICLIGPPFSDRQLQAAVTLTKRLMAENFIPVENVRGHKEEDPKAKSDPRLDMNAFRSRLKT